MLILSWKNQKTNIYIRNVNDTFNKKESIKHIVEVNVYYKRYRKRTEIDIIREQK